jgi:hypothetical protein
MGPGRLDWSFVNATKTLARFGGRCLVLDCRFSRCVDRRTDRGAVPTDHAVGFPGGTKPVREKSNDDARYPSLAAARAN